VFGVYIKGKMLLKVEDWCPLHSVKFQKIPSGANMKSALKPKKSNVTEAAVMVVRNYLHAS